MALLNESIGKLILNKLRNDNSQKIILTDLSCDKSFTAKELADESVKVAIGLQKLGVNKEDVVTIIAENSYKLITTLLAVFLLGAKAFCLCWSSVDELMHFFNICDPKFVCFSKINLENLLRVHKKYSFKKLICFDFVDIDNIDLAFYQDFLLNITNNELEDFQPVDVKPKEEVCLILTSSGTTGLPKCVLIYNFGFQCALEIFRDPDLIGLDENDVILANLLISHMYGLSVCFGALYSGSSVIIPEKMSQHMLFKTVETHKTVKLFVVPPTLLFLIKNEKAGYDLSSLKEVFCGGAQLPPVVEEKLKPIYNFVIRGVYGMTETTGIMTIVPKSSQKLGTIGKPTKFTEIKIMKVDSNEVLEPYEIGEIRCKSMSQMKGYLQNDKETHASFDENGWLKSGDLGYYDEEGIICHISRCKEILKYKGFQISPLELENLIIKHPSINDVAVVGMPDEEVGDKPYAFVVLKPNENITEEELLKYVAENISRHKHLHGVKFIKQIPRNSIGKIMRRGLGQGV